MSKLKELTIRPRLGSGNIKLLEQLIGMPFSEDFKEFMMNNAGLSHYECIYEDTNGTKWEIQEYNQFKDLYNLTKEFKKEGLGLKLPFAHDPGGWHYCLSFDKDTYGKIYVNRWTDHVESEQLLMISEDFESFINKLKPKEE